MVKKTLMFIYYDDVKFEKLATVAYKSFNIFNTDPNITTVVCVGEKNQTSPGFRKFQQAFIFAKKHNFEKVIILGSDTITCSRLDEFLDNDVEDVLATLDYRYRIPLNIKNSTNDNHVNADVVCFNNLDALEAVLSLNQISCISAGENIYHEQGALNYLLFSDIGRFSYKIVDSPYPETGIVYNTRSKGTMTGSTFINTIKDFKVTDNKLYDANNCHIKLYHYCAGFGTHQNIESFQKRVNEEKSYFNLETRNWFTSTFDTDFFNTEFKV